MHWNQRNNRKLLQRRKEKDHKNTVLLNSFHSIASQLLAESMDQEAMYSGFILIHQQWNSNPYHSYTWK